MKIINDIKLVSGEKLLSKQKHSKYSYYIFENDIILSGKDILTINVLIKCNGLDEWFECKFKSYFLTKKWFSLKFYGIHKNPFKGKKHSDDTKQKISLKNKGKLAGDKNPFYGKKHSDETKKILSEITRSKNLRGENNAFYGKKHSTKSREKMSNSQKMYWNNLPDIEKDKKRLQMVDIQKRLMQQDEKKYRESRSKAGKITAKVRKYQKNKLEIKVENALHSIGLYDFEYSVIMGYKQYDFGLKDKKILLEVQGDYWHGNPLIYPIDKLNSTQISNMKKDIEKKEFAIKNGFRIYYIWEKDVNENNFEVLERIKNDIE